MKQNRDVALTFVIEQLEDLSVNENEPASVGGISKGGVTLVSYADYCAKSGLPAPTADDIRNLTEDQMKTFYAAQWMTPLRFDELPSGVDCAVFGFAVQAGLTGATELLAIGSGFWPVPTTMTNQLIAHVVASDPRAVIGGLGGAWASRKYDGTEWSRYGHGWTNRFLKQNAQSIPLAGGQAVTPPPS